MRDFSQTYIGTIRKIGEQGKLFKVVRYQRDADAFLVLWADDQGRFRTKNGWGFIASEGIGHTLQVKP